MTDTYANTLKKLPTLSDDQLLALFRDNFEQFMFESGGYENKCLALECSDELLLRQSLSEENVRRIVFDSQLLMEFTDQGPKKFGELAIAMTHGLGEGWKFVDENA